MAHGFPSGHPRSRRGVFPYAIALTLLMSVAAACWSDNTVTDPHTSPSFSMSGPCPQLPEALRTLYPNCELMSPAQFGRIYNYFGDANWYRYDHPACLQLSDLFDEWSANNRIFVVPMASIDSALGRYHRYPPGSSEEYVILAAELFPDPAQDTNMSPFIPSTGTQVSWRRLRMNVAVHEASHSYRAGGYADTATASKPMTAHDVGNYCSFTSEFNPFGEPDPDLCPDGTEPDAYGCVGSDEYSESGGNGYCETGEVLWIHTRYEWDYGQQRYYAAYTWYTCEDTQHYN